MSAIKLYDELIASGIVGANGTTYFELHGIKTQVQDNSVIGNSIQEWLAAFMDQHGITYTKLDNSQVGGDWRKNWIKVVTEKYQEKSGNPL